MFHLANTENVTYSYKNEIGIRQRDCRANWNWNRSHAMGIDPQEYLASTELAQPTTPTPTSRVHLGMQRHELIRMVPNVTVILGSAIASGGRTTGQRRTGILTDPHLSHPTTRSGHGAEHRVELGREHERSADGIE